MQTPGPQTRSNKLEPLGVGAMDLYLKIKIIPEYSMAKSGLRTMTLTYTSSLSLSFSHSFQKLDNTVHSVL